MGQIDVGLMLKLIRKKICDMKIRTKMGLSLLVIVVLCCFGIGLYSYRIAKNAVIENAEVTVTNLVKQMGLNLDERIEAVRDVSYQMCETGKINKILNMNVAEAKSGMSKYKDSLSTAVLQRNALYDYTKYALLRPESGIIYEYYKTGMKKKKALEEEKILNFLSQKLTTASPTTWMVYDGQAYFARKIVIDYQDRGTLCIALTDDFFQFIGTTSDYLKNEEVVVANAQGEFLKNAQQMFGIKELEQILDYNNGSFYVYTDYEEKEDDSYLTIALKTQDNSWRLACFMPFSRLLQGVTPIYGAIIKVMIAFLLLSGMISYIFSRTITRNADVIVQGMKNFEEGHFERKLKPVNYDEIGLLALQMNFMGLKIQGLMGLLEQKERQKMETEFQVLQAQINPHFLYNTLGSLKWVAYRQGNKDLAASIDSLIQLLRFTIKNAGAMITLSEEIHYIENYVAIEKMKYGDMFAVNYQLEPETEELLLPGFVLQPFVENSILHGMDMAEQGGEICICAKKKRNILELSISDNGCGMTEEKKQELLMGEPEKKKRGLNSIGIRIVDQRLRNIYGEKYQIVMDSEIGKGTRITLRLPVTGGKENEVEDSTGRG
ncbi:sensor histidine kinase [Blautia sp. MSJ-19]|uniref:sensor histidine kinase n=1 Tax=Blautia sp. MSJ-19 TaxID=2841517 RepID=UPI001C0EC795